MLRMSKGKPKSNETDNGKACVDVLILTQSKEVIDIQ